MIKKLKFGKVRIIFLAGFIITASFRYVNAAQPEPVTFLHMYSSSYGKPAMDKTVESVNRERSLFQINAVSFEHEPFKVSIKAMLRGGNPPDIFLYWAGERVQLLVDAGHLAPIDDLWKLAKLN